MKRSSKFISNISFVPFTFMPQIDKITFLTTVYWTFIFYFFLYLDLSVTYLYKFFTMLKLRHQRMCWVYRHIQINTLRARILASRVLNISLRSKVEFPFTNSNKTNHGLYKNS